VLIAQAVFLLEREQTVKQTDTTERPTPRRRLYSHADFLKVPPNKNEGQKTQILHNFASSRNILSAITCDVEGK